MMRPGVVFPNEWLSNEWHKGSFHTGGTEPWTLNVVAALMMAKGANKVLEIGTYMGHASVWLCHILEHTSGGVFTGVDLEPARAAGTLATLEDMDYANVDFKVACDDSVEFLRASDPNSWDFVWLDGSHSKEHVRKELHWLIDEGRIQQGGTICMHDVIGHFDLAPLCLERGGAVFTFPQIHAAGGLGVIQV